MSDSDLTKWVKEELMADATDELTANKERVKRFIRLTPEGNVMINERGLTSRVQVALYYVGAAYAKAAGLRADASVSNREISERLGMPEGTVHPKVKELRDGHFIEAEKDGVHVVNYARLGSLLTEAEKRGATSS